MIDVIISWIRVHWPLMLILSGITIIASLVSVAVMIISLPPDYFARQKRLNRIKNPILRIGLRIVRNIVGAFALVAGLIMLIGPGQGILTILVGVILCDLPGKRKLERRLIARPFVLDVVNRIRLRYKRPPIVVDD